MTELGDAVGCLLRLADKLRRRNAVKWGLSVIDWQTAVTDVLDALDSTETQFDKSEAVANTIRAARSSVRRLADSGAARFASASVARDPDSSWLVSDSTMIVRLRTSASRFCAA